MNVFISFFLTIVVYFLIIYFFFYTITHNKHEIIEVSNKAYIHEVIKPKTKTIVQTEKKEIKTTTIAKTTKDVSTSGEEDIAFDDIFSNVDSNINDIKKIKVAKKETIVNSNNENSNSMIEYVKQKTSNIKLNSDIKIQLSKDANITDEKLEKFYSEVDIIWNSFNLDLGDTAVVKFNSNGFKLIYSNLNDNIKTKLLQKLQGLDLSVLNGSIKITFSAKEEK